MVSDHSVRQEPAENTSLEYQQKVEHATQLGRDLLDFNVATTSSSSSKPTKREMSSSADSGCNPPKKNKGCGKTV